VNDRLLEILAARPDFNVTGQAKRALDVFCEYLDHGSLFMTGYEAGDDPTFSFTNDAQIYRFRLSEIVAYVAGMKQGTPIDWEQVPFEYITKG
jgi:hypothetical protein